MRPTIYGLFLIRILLILINSFGAFHLYDGKFSITLLALVLLLCYQIFLFIDALKRLFADVEKSIDCLLHDDYSVSISTNKQRNVLHKKTAKLISKYRNKNKQQISEQLIFDNIIESLSIGILILRKNATGNIEVYQINSTFTGFLQIPKFYNWHLLKDKIKPLADLIDDNHWGKLRHVISLTINDKEESFFLKTSVANTYEFDYLIVSLETIQQLIDKKEKESWYKLMNVMSHEIINTITPISSLASNLDSLLKDENPDKETLEELSQGLQIIKKRSSHLTNFVNTYRRLAELPLPDKKETNLIQLIQNTLSLFKQEFEEKNVIIVFEPKIEPILLIDRKQIEQVIINLISNSLYALKENPKITIHLEELSNRINIIFSDNGIGIPNSIKGSVFVPYFTTRKNGSGIGLTLAKSIMESHGGIIYFKSEKGKTIFILSFV